MKKISKFESLESDIEELQQYGRRNAIVVSGLPENQNENTGELILNLAKDKLNVNLEQYEISRSHRLGPPRNPSENPRNIVVKFVSYNVRRRIYEARKSLNRSVRGSIYICEHLTRFRSNLYYEARQLLKRGKVKYAWTSDGRVLVRDHAGKAY